MSDDELLERLEEIIAGDKMIGVEAAALGMKRDAERYHRAVALLREIKDAIPPWLPEYHRIAQFLAVEGE